MVPITLKKPSVAIPAVCVEATPAVGHFTAVAAHGLHNFVSNLRHPGSGTNFRRSALIVFVVSSLSLVAKTVSWREPIFRS